MEARALLARAEEQLRGSWVAPLGVLLCQRGTVEHRAGNPEVARVALAEAEQIEVDLGCGPASELAMAVRELQTLLC